MVFPSYIPDDIDDMEVEDEFLLSKKNLISSTWAVGETEEEGINLDTDNETCSTWAVGETEAKDIETSENILHSVLNNEQMDTMFEHMSQLKIEEKNRNIEKSREMDCKKYSIQDDEYNCNEEKIFLQHDTLHKKKKCYFIHYVNKICDQILDIVNTVTKTPFEIRQYTEEFLFDICWICGQIDFHPDYDCILHFFIKLCDHAQIKPVVDIHTISEHCNGAITELLKQLRNFKTKRRLEQICRTETTEISNIPKTTEISNIPEIPTQLIG